MSSCVCKISFKSVQVCGGCCKMFRGLTFFGTQCMYGVRHQHCSFAHTTITTVILALLLWHPFNGLFSNTTWVSRYQKGKTSLDFNEARGDGVSGQQRHQRTRCKQSASRSWQLTTPTSHHSIFTGRMLFLTPNQQCQTNEGCHCHYCHGNNFFRILATSTVIEKQA